MSVATPVAPSLPLGSEAEDVSRLVRLAADLSRYASGHPPTFSESSEVPLIKDWRVVPDPTAVRLAERVSHIRRSGVLQSCSRGATRFDPEGGGVRTYSHLRRTGPSSDGTPTELQPKR